MNAANTIAAAPGKFAGLTLDLHGLGRVHLTELIAENVETSVYRVDHPGLVVKLFDLECGQPDEVSYGPFVAFNLERENFQDIDEIPQLKRCVPAFYGADIDYEHKRAFIAMEYLPGQNLMDWCQTEVVFQEGEKTQDLRAAVYETLRMVTHFHEHGIFLIDFKPDNVIRLHDGRIKFVDLGAFFTPRHSRETEKYVYSATPDYAELVIDTSNVQTGRPLSESSDIFAAGVALFEMTTGRSRLAIADDTAELILGLPELYRFRDTQIRDVWHAYPHLKDLLPLVERQLRERRLLFAEVWYLIKGLLAHEVPHWDTLPEDQHHQLLLETGRNLISDQLPWKLDWLAESITRATTFRSLRLKTVPDLLGLVADPISTSLREELVRNSGLSHYLEDSGISPDFLNRLNTWEVKQQDETGRWAVLLPSVCTHVREMAPFTFLRHNHTDAAGHSFFTIVSELDAEPVEGGALTLLHLEESLSAWIVD